MIDRAALNSMEIGFDPAKSRMNVADANRGFGFEIVAGFDFETAEMFEDDRFDYGEIRYIALGRVGPRVHVVVFTLREPVLWVISLRKANERETRRYVRYLEAG